MATADANHPAVIGMVMGPGAFLSCWRKILSDNVWLTRVCRVSYISAGSMASWPAASGYHYIRLPNGAQPDWWLCCRCDTLCRIIADPLLMLLGSFMVAQRVLRLPTLLSAPKQLHCMMQDDAGDKSGESRR